MVELTVGIFLPGIDFRWSEAPVLAPFDEYFGGLGDAGSSFGSTLGGSGDSWEWVWIPMDFHRFPGWVQNPTLASSGG